MRAKFPIFLVALMAISTNSYGAQLRLLSEHDKIKAIVSSRELNRIAVEGDRIAQVFGASGRFTLETDEIQGQIFIQPIGGTKPLSLTIITESGITQDIVLTPTDIASQTIVLKRSRASSQQAKQWEISQPYQQAIINLIQALAQRKEITGFKVQVDEQLVPLWKDLEVRQLQTYVGDRLKGVIYELKNTGNEVHILHEQHLQFAKDVAAIALEARHLAPGEKTYLLVVKHA